VHQLVNKTLTVSRCTVQLWKFSAVFVSTNWCVSDQQYRCRLSRTLIRPTWAVIAQSVQQLATGRTVRGSNPGEGEIFRTCPDRTWDLRSLLYNGYLVFPVSKAAEAWRSPPTPSSAEVKERVQPYLYSPSGPSSPVLGWNVPLPLPRTSNCLDNNKGLFSRNTLFKLAHTEVPDNFM